MKETQLGNSSQKKKKRTAHVSEGTLTGAVSTGSLNARNTGDGTTSSPGDSGVVMSLHGGGGIRLTLVLVHQSVNSMNDVRANGADEDFREGNGAGGGTVDGLNGDKRTSSLE